MKYLVLYFFILTFTLKSQDYGIMTTTGYDDLKSVKKQLDEQIKRSQKLKIIRNFSFESKNDTLFVFFQDSVYGMKYKFTFNKFDSLLNKKYCDFEQIIFDCNPCAQRNLKDYLNSKSFGFRKVQENHYLSKFSWQSELFISYSNGNKSCLSLIFRYKDLPKKEYKALYNSLPRK